MQTITVLTANLFRLAAQYYGNQDQFIRIMYANGLTDPMINSPTPVTLIIPSVQNPDNGGIPTAGISTPWTVD